MVTRLVAGLTAVLGAAALAGGVDAGARSPGGPTRVEAGGASLEGASILQGQVLAVSDDGRRLDARITLRWAPDVASLDERTRFATDPLTAVRPGGRLTGLRPGDPVEIVALHDEGGGWRALEVTKVDLD